METPQPTKPSPINFLIPFSCLRSLRTTVQVSATVIVSLYSVIIIPCAIGSVSYAVLRGHAAQKPSVTTAVKYLSSSFLAAPISYVFHVISSVQASTYVLVVSTATFVAVLTYLQVNRRQKSWFVPSLNLVVYSWLVYLVGTASPGLSDFFNGTVGARNDGDWWTRLFSAAVKTLMVAVILTLVQRTNTVLVQDSRVKKPSSNIKSGNEINKKLKHFRTYFDSDNSDDSENAPPHSTFTRRTKFYTPNHGKTHSMPINLSEKSVTSDHRSENKSYSSGKRQSKPTILLMDRTVSPCGVETESSSSVSIVGESSLPKPTTSRVHSRRNISRGQFGAPSRGVENKPSSRSSHASEALSKNHVSSLEPETFPKTVSRNYSSTNVPPRALVAHGCGDERMSSLKNSNANKAAAKLVPEMKSSMGIHEQLRSMDRDRPKVVPESRISSQRESVKSFTGQQNSNCSPKSPKSKLGEALKRWDVSNEIPSKATASHVHPNLPDYDAFSAFFQSLKQPRE